MNKPKVHITKTKETEGYSATTKINNDFIATEGDSFEDLKANILEALNLSFEDSHINFSIDDIGFNYDLASFFEFYKVINAKALSERIEMNQSLLAQYIRGTKKPSKKQTNRILKGVQKIGKELSEVNFLL